MEGFVGVSILAFLYRDIGTHIHTIYTYINIDIGADTYIG